MDAGGPEQSPQALPEALAKRTRNRVCFRFKKIRLCNVARCAAAAQHAALRLTAAPPPGASCSPAVPPTFSNERVLRAGTAHGFRSPLFLFSVLLHKPTHSRRNYGSMALHCSTARVRRRLWPCCN